jgi:hypothetical protein
MHWYEDRLSSAGTRHILDTLLACHLTGCHIHALLHDNICLFIIYSCSKPDVRFLSFIIGLYTLLSININCKNTEEYFALLVIATNCYRLTQSLTHSLTHSITQVLTKRYPSTRNYLIHAIYTVHLRSSLKTIKNKYTVSAGKVVVMDIKMRL